MDQPWGLSGPQFLGIYIAGIAVAVLIPVALRRILRNVPGRGIGRELDPYEVAYLAGGPQRAAEVVIAELVACGSLRVDSAGRLSEADRDARTGPHAAALDKMSPGGMPDGLKTAAVCRKLRSDPGIAGIGHSLRAEGMVLSSRRVAALRLVTVVLTAVLLGTGIARLAEGAANHRPVDFLVLLFILSIFVCIGLLAVMLTSSRTTTSQGSAYLERLRAAGQADQVLPVSAAPVPAYLAGAAIGVPLLGVALSGFSAVPDEEMRTALLAGMPTSSGGSSSCGGGSGCGGGCGGGGCGG